MIPNSDHGEMNSSSVWNGGKVKIVIEARPVFPHAEDGLKHEQITFHGKTRLSDRKIYLNLNGFWGTG